MQLSFGLLYIVGGVHQSIIRRIRPRDAWRLTIALIRRRSGSRISFPALVLVYFSLMVRLLPTASASAKAVRHGARILARTLARSSSVVTCAGELDQKLGDLSKTSSSDGKVHNTKAKKLICLRGKQSKERYSP